MNADEERIVLYGLDCAINTLEMLRNITRNCLTDYAREHPDDAQAFIASCERDMALARATRDRLTAHPEFSAAERAQLEYDIQGQVARAFFKERAAWLDDNAGNRLATVAAQAAIQVLDSWNPLP